MNRLRSGLRSVLRLRAQSRGQALAFYDTFDWRLYAAGWLLEVEQFEAAGYRATCRALEDGRILNQRLDHIPERLADWPQGRLRELLSQITGVRELVQVAILRGAREHFNVLNGDNKTISHLSIDDWRVCCGCRELDDWPKNRVRFTPLKGWEEETEAAAASVMHVHVRPASRTLLESALARLGRKPLDYSSKLAVELSPGMDSASAVREVLLELLATMRANETGMKQAIDTEFLHDFRVAVRRTRSALTQIKGVFQPESTDCFREEFAWLGRVTGPRRDLDVQLLKFDAHKTLLPPELQEDLESLRAFLQRKQLSAGEELAQALASERYRRLVHEWRQFLESTDRSMDGPAAGRRAKGVADERIWKLFRKILKQGQAIRDDSPAEALHDLRKSCKKLRYLMEFFYSLYPEKKVRKTIKQLKRLQDNLGEFQDQAVQMAALREFADEMHRESADSKALLAIGALIERIADQHQQTRAEFAERFERFCRPRNRKLFAELFKPRSPEANTVADHCTVQH